MAIENDLAKVILRLFQGRRHFLFFFLSRTDTFSTMQRRSPRRTKFGDLRYPDLEAISKKKISLDRITL